MIFNSDKTEMKKILTIIVYTLTSASILLAQQGFNHIDIDQGLSQNEVTDILQDSRGFMWFATYNGLNRYDGYDFKVYKSIHGDSTSLRINKIMALFEDHNGVLWIGTFGGGLSRFNRKQESFTTFMNDPADENSLADNRVLTILEDSKHRLWIGTQNGGLTLFLNDDSFESLGGTARFLNFSNDSDDPLNTNNKGAIKIYEDSNGNVWFTTLDGLLNRLDDSQGRIEDYQFQSFDPELEYAPDALYISIDQIMEDRNHPGLLWLASSSAGLIWFDSNSEKFFYAYPHAKLPPDISFNKVWSMCWAEGNEVWLGTFGDGIYSFILNEDMNAIKKFDHYQFEKINPNLTDAPNVRDIYEDRSGMIWFGANPNGLYTLVKRAERFRSIHYDPSDKNSLISDYVLSVLETDEGNLWIGTEYGLDIFNPDGDKLFSFQHNPEVSGSLSSDIVYSLHQDHQGAVWVGTASGLDKFLPETNAFKHYRHNPLNTNSLNHGEIIKLFSDSKGTLWVGSWNGGLNKYVPGEAGEADKFLHYTFDVNNKFTISDNRIMSIAEDRTGNLWFGTSEGGLNRLISDYSVSGDGSLIPPKFERYQHEPGNPNSLGNNDVRTILVDGNNNLWLGTFGGGLDKLVRNDMDEPQKFIHYSEEDGLPNDVVRGILEDNVGNFWISTANGLSRFDPKTSSFWNFGTSDGLQTTKFEDAYCKSKLDGMLCFGGIGGIVAFYPDELQINKKAPGVTITSFKRYTQKGDVMTEKGISEKKEISLSYKDKIISLEFAALSFSNPFKNHYAYQLEGYNNNWIELGTKRDVTFTNLDPGSYVLKVKGSNEDGIWSDKPASLNISISPPWWSTFWAYGAYAILILSVLYGLRNRELKRRLEKEEKRILELENDRKTKELEEARKLQLSMLPKEVPRLPNLDLAAYMQTATEVGGDFYDFHVKDDGTLTAVVADATGHGMQAGMMVSITKGLFQNLAVQPDLEHILHQFNQSLCSMELQPLLMSLLLFRIIGKNLEIVNGGMPDLLVYRKKNNCVEEIKSSGPPLGAYADYHYKKYSSGISTDDVILTMTDGFAERFNEQEEIFGYEKCKDILKEVITGTSRQMIDYFNKKSDGWAGSREPDDDMTFVIAKCK